LVHPCEFFWDYWATWPFAHDDLTMLVDDGLDKVASLVADVLDLLLALIALAVSCCLFAVIL
jgi:hypothetical protein